MLIDYHVSCEYVMLRDNKELYVHASVCLNSNPSHLWHIILCITVNMEFVNILCEYVSDPLQVFLLSSDSFSTTYLFNFITIHIVATSFSLWFEDKSIWVLHRHLYYLITFRALLIGLNMCILDGKTEYRTYIPEF